MSKLQRVTQKQFGSTAGISQIGVFGSLAAGSIEYTTDPAAVQSLSNFLDGWYSAVVGENSPSIQDMNALFFLAFYQFAYLMQQGIPEWDSGTTYYTGSLVQDGSGNIYTSLQNNNLNHALTNTSYWGIQGGSFRTVTSSTTLTSSDIYVRSNSTSASLTMTLPAISSTPVGKKITIKDVGTGGNTTTIVGSGTDVIDGNNTYSATLNEYDSLTVFNNGTSWDVI